MNARISKAVLFVLLVIPHINAANGQEVIIVPQVSEAAPSEPIPLDQVISEAKRILGNDVEMLEETAGIVSASDAPSDENSTHASVTLEGNSSGSTPSRPNIRRAISPGEVNDLQTQARFRYDGILKSKEAAFEAWFQESESIANSITPSHQPRTTQVDQRGETTQHTNSIESANSPSSASRDVEVAPAKVVPKPPQQNHIPAVVPPTETAVRVPSAASHHVTETVVQRVCGRCGKVYWIAIQN